MKPARLAILAALAVLPAQATTLTFREDSAGYSGTQDTYLEQNSPGTDFGAATLIRWDGDHPAGTLLVDYVLLRFDGLFGPGPGQIPVGTTITPAVLSYTVSNTGNPGEVHEAFAPWEESTTFADYCGAGLCDENQIGPLVGTALGDGAGTRTVNVTASVQAWSSGVENLGWIITPTGTDGVEIVTSEAALLANRPLLTVSYGGPAVVPREPYLQLGTPTSMTIVWRTDVGTDSRVRYGTTPGVFDHEVVDGNPGPDHKVTLSGLSPATRYYYEVGSTTSLQAGGTLAHFFDTSPAPGATVPFRAWVVGDSGNGSAAQLAVRDAMLAATASDPPDLFLHMGDIAYNAGTDAEFTEYHFAPYSDVLRNTVLWPTLGNHEGTSTTSGDPGPSAGPYYSAFVLPSAGEAGGAPSGTEAYYSFDYANVHFVCLNSYQVDRSATGAMAAWLQTDLAANTLPWVVAFWHHPPYTRGSHDSDFEISHIEMRENLLPILEAGGVDLVLGGHSHGYERSYLLDAATMTPTPDLTTLILGGYILDSGDGDPAGDGPYRKDPGIQPHQGAVYVVAGHGGADVGGPMNHPVMYFSEAVHGSVIMDVNGDTITLQNLRSTGAISDTFTLVKTLPAPRIVSVDPLRNGTVQNLTSIEVVFDAAVTGVDASDLTVNGVPASSVASAAADRYVFQIDPPPLDGPATVVVATGAITGVAPSLGFRGDTWNYTIGSVCGNDVSGLRIAADHATLTWDPTAGPDGLYDVSRGSLTGFPVGSGADICVALDLTNPTVVDGVNPAAGQGFWYLVRGRNKCSPGLWGFEGVGGQPTVPRSTSACP